MRSAVVTKVSVELRHLSSFRGTGWFLVDLWVFTSASVLNKLLKLKEYWSKNISEPISFAHTLVI